MRRCFQHAVMPDDADALKSVPCFRDFFAQIALVLWMRQTWPGVCIACIYKVRIGFSIGDLTTRSGAPFAGSAGITVAGVSLVSGGCTGVFKKMLSEWNRIDTPCVLGQEGK
jgi:hypothetical protein